MASKWQKNVLKLTAKSFMKLHTIDKSYAFSVFTKGKS